MRTADHQQSKRSHGPAAGDMDDDGRGGLFVTGVRAVPGRLLPNGAVEEAGLARLKPKPEGVMSNRGAIAAGSELAVRLMKRGKRWSEPNARGASSTGSRCRGGTGYNLALISSTLVVADRVVLRDHLVVKMSGRGGGFCATVW